MGEFVKGDDRTDCSFLNVAIPVEMSANETLNPQLSNRRYRRLPTPFAAKIHRSEKCARTQIPNNTVCTMLIKSLDKKRKQ